MRLATKKALLASIEHWKQNETAESLDDVHLGRDHCPLCKRFGDDCVRRTKTTIERCPVYAKTGGNSCRLSPYQAAADAHNNETLRTFRRAAKAERKFLESLLPIEPQS